MARNKHIGFVIFALCSAISAKLAVFEPQPREKSRVEDRWGAVQRQDDQLGILHGLRYYIYGIGVIGLLIVAEDVIAERQRKLKKNQPLLPDAGIGPSTDEALPPRV